MCTKLQLNVNLFPVICCLMEVNTFCGHARLKIVSSAYVNVEISRRIASSLQAITDFSSLLVSISLWKLWASTSRMDVFWR